MASAATGPAFVRMASKVPSVSSAPTPTDMDLGVTEPVCVCTEHVITAWTVTAPASQARVERAQPGGSVTGSLQRVVPMCSSVTSTPPVNTAVGQPAVSAMRAMKGTEFSVLRRTLAWDQPPEEAVVKMQSASKLAQGHTSVCASRAGQGTEGTVWRSTTACCPEQAAATTMPPVSM